jgi:hypothetical protein
VSQALLDLLGVGALRDQHRSARMAEIMESQTVGKAGGGDGRLEVSAVEVPP